jgi:hypothetical protein
LTTVADVVDQGGLGLQCQQIIMPMDDLSAQCDRHHPSPVIQSRLPIGETASPVSSAFTECRQSTTHLSAALFFFMRAPPLS